MPRDAYRRLGFLHAEAVVGRLDRSDRSLHEGAVWTNLRPLDAVAGQL
jgi:hypothetical protein